MFAFLSRFLSRPKPKASPRRKASPLALEELERRDCPAAPVLLSFAAAPINVGTQVQIDGTVSDENPSTVSISIDGVVSLFTTPDAQGNFSIVAEAYGLGGITATAIDDEGLISETLQDTISSAAPTISLDVSYGAGRMVTLSGQVTDESPGGLVVTLAGVVNETVTTNADGTFSLTAEASGLGTVTAVTTDVWGQQSNTASVEITSNAPVISEFVCILDGDTWSFQGTVSDESPEGLVVRFWGIPSMEGLTTTVSSAGVFYLTVPVAPDEFGTVFAQTTDWWGLDSNTPGVPI